MAKKQLAPQLGQRRSCLSLQQQGQAAGSATWWPWQQGHFVERWHPCPKSTHNVALKPRILWLHILNSSTA